MPLSDDEDQLMSTSESTASSSLHHHQHQASPYMRQAHPPFQPSTPSWLRKKPLWVVMRELSNDDHPQPHEHHLSPSSQQQIKRHLSLLDLISVGVGGTIGSGIFVLAGFIAHNYAGPATPISFAIAGIAAAFSGVCYAELSGRIPSAGSTYVYSYVCMGEMAAVIAASCLTLEYGVSGAAVARSWGDKFVVWLRDQWHLGDAVESYLEPQGINLMAGLVSTVSVALLLAGVNESKKVTNFFTLTKILLVIFMIVGGMFLFQFSNITSETNSFAPKGAAGILRGATSSFFGYLGYDEACCLAGEAMHPRRDMPRAVLWTLLIVTVLYIFSSFFLTGMLPSDQISETSGFPAAFHDRGASWSANISAAGEVFTLPVVVLISLMAQPRLQYALAKDGLLPPIFAQTDETGNPKWGTFLSGSAMVVVATFIPFTYLDDLISVGILLAFSMTNSCLILLRCESPVQQPLLVEKHLILLNGLCLATGMLFSHAWTLTTGPIMAFLSLIATLCVVVSLAVHCPQSMKFGGSILRPADSHPDLHGTIGASLGADVEEEHYFQTPFVPYLPCSGIFINWCLVSQLELSGLFLLFLYVGVTVGIYMVYCNGNSFGGSLSWKRSSYQSLAGLEYDPDHWPMLEREYSMPPVKADVLATRTTTKNGINGSLT